MLRNIIILILSFSLMISIKNNINSNKEIEDLKQNLILLQEKNEFLIDLITVTGPTLKISQKRIQIIADSIKQYNPSLTEFEREIYAYTLIKASLKFNIKKEIIFYTIVRESTWDPYAVSPVGATGLMQVMPQVWKIRTEELKNPIRNIYEGTKVFKKYLVMEKGNYKKALYKYSGGAGDYYWQFILASAKRNKLNN